MSDRPEIYLDHAATSFPKPPDVFRSLRSWSESLGASAGRGEYPRATGTADLISNCRNRLASILGAADPSRVIFTLNCTDALNIAIRGIGLSTGDRVIVGPTEHNSVMRPLNAIAGELNLEIVRLPAHPNGRIEPEWIDAHLEGADRHVGLVAVQHASNVLGALMPIKEIASRCRAAGAPLLVDAAQTAGSVPLDMASLGIDMLALPGHKGLQGPLGTGILAIAPGIELLPWRMGGTGSRSEEEIQPVHYPDRLESGSHNAPGIAGLLGALDWVERRGGVEAIRRREEGVIQRFLAGLSDLERIYPVRILGPTIPEEKSAVVTIAAEHIDPGTFSRKLWEEHGIMTRPGLHCAPSAHALAGTYPGGAVRFSFGPLTEIHEAESALRAIEIVLSTGRNPEFKADSSRRGALLRR